MLKNKALAASVSAPPVGWDITTASFSGTPFNFLGILGQVNNPRGIFLDSSGVRLYTVTTTGDLVLQYSLSTPWDLNTGSYLRSFSVTSQNTNPVGVAFSSDGTKMYVTGITSVHQYNLSTAWDISTSSFSTTFSISGQTSDAGDLAFDSTGAFMYVTDGSTRAVDQYTLSTPWSLSTATYTRTLDVSTQLLSAFGVAFKSDGTKVYISGRRTTVSNAVVAEYTLSTAWNLSTASFTQRIDFPVVDGELFRGLIFKSDGVSLFVANDQGDRFVKYTLSTAWDTSTASITYPTTDWYSVASQLSAFSNATSVTFEPDGSGFYVCGSSSGSGVTGEIDQYSTSTNWELNTASYITTYEVTAQTINPTAVKFKSDGTSAYVGSTSGVIYQYTLSTPWDISTASYASKSFNPSAQTTGSYGFALKEDGNSLYISSFSANTLYQYTLSTPWDISTASYASKSMVGGGGSSLMCGVFFKSDGLKLYILNYTSNGSTVDQYTLSTAWDISTATYYGRSLNLGVKGLGGTILGLDYKYTGGQFYVIDFSFKQVWAFDVQ
jgi:sugar lactone lactonase YvrE